MRRKKTWCLQATSVVLAATAAQRQLLMQLKVKAKGHGGKSPVPDFV